MPLKLEHRKEEILEMYQSGMTTYRISKEIGEYEQAVINVLRSVIHIPKKVPLKINEKYFENIDSVDKAYFFGLIAADGAIVYNMKQHPSMTISLTQEDGYILEKLKEATNAEVTIKEYKQSYQKRDGFVSTQKRFVTTNRNFVSHLLDHNMTPLKSHTLGNLLLEVEDDFKVDFIRGYFDGDGSIYQTVTSGKQIRHYCGFRGTKELLEGIKDYLPFNGGTITWGTSNGSNGQYEWKFGAKKDIATFRDLIYHNDMNDYYLTRKYDKFPW